MSTPNLNCPVCDSYVGPDPHSGQQCSNNQLRRVTAKMVSLDAKLAEVTRERDEQCRLLGISGSQEAKLLAEIAALKKERDELLEITEGKSKVFWDEYRKLMHEEHTAKDATIALLERKLDVAGKAVSHLAIWSNNALDRRLGREIAESIAALDKDQGAGNG